MDVSARPRLRPLLGRKVIQDGLDFVSLEDSLGLFSGQVLIPLRTYQLIVRHLDGQNSLREICELAQAQSGQHLALKDLVAIIDRLDQALVIEGSCYRALAESYAQELSRPPYHAGRSYSADPETLGSDLARLFRGPGGLGMPPTGEIERSGSVRAILSPHIDFGRGGPIYSSSYKALVEESDAEVFVILGVAHQATRNRFALTRKDFQTPLGTAKTDRTFVDRLAAEAGGHFFEDELAHRTEHSIEFQVVFLQHVLGTHRNFSIVPILVGSFQDLMKGGGDPIDDPEVGRMIRALRSVESTSSQKVAYIGGIDLCHVGPEFGDTEPVDDPMLAAIRAFDDSMLDRAALGDPIGWFARAAEVDNRWRVCGLAATYTLLKAIEPARGRVLGYDQAVNPSRTCCVSFASVAFEAIRPEVR